MDELVILKSYKDVKAKKIERIWKPYIACGKITILQGDPGDGKSTLALKLCSILTSDIETKEKIDGVIDGTINVIYQSAEDDPEDTIKPKLNKLKSNTDKLMYVVNDEIIDLTSNALKNIIEKANAKLIILDPLQSFIKKGENMLVATYVRKMMKNLTKIANETNCAILLIGHLNKSEGKKDLYRGLGSIDLTAVARSVLYLKRSDLDSRIRIMYQIKNSLAAEGYPVAYKLDDKKGMIWLGKYTNEELTTEKATKDKLSVAKDFLLRILSNVEKIEVSELKELCTNYNISYRTLVRAKKELEIESIRANGKWYWKY